jgi:hypothetical protein
VRAVRGVVQLVATKVHARFITAWPEFDGRSVWVAMKTIALAFLVIGSSGCFLLPFPDGSGGPATKQASGPLTCAAAQQDAAAQPTVEGQWQDWFSSFKIFTFKGGAVTVTSFDAQGKPGTEVTGRYATNKDSVSITWDDGKTENVGFNITNSPGCEMLAVREDRGDVARLPVTGFGQELERVDCSGVLPPETATATPATK